MEAILDFSAPVNVKAFDDIFAMFSEGGRGDIARAQEILEEFKKHPDAFFKVDKLLTTSNTLGTKFFALQVLDDTIMQRWNTLDVENQQAIRNFILNLIVQECTTFPHIRSKNTRAFLTKLNSTLVSIAKREWPIRWPTFVQDICSIADPTLPLVENNLNLLRIVGEEVFQFGEKTLTSRWIERKKQALANDFKSIVNLCISVLTATQDFCLMNVALETLTAYAPWMSPSLICSTILLERVCDLVSVPEVRVHAVHCLAEICSVTVDSGSQGDEQTNLIVCAFRTALERVVMVLPTSHSEVMHRVVQLYDCGSSFDREFVVYLNLLITSFLRNRCKSISYDEVLLVTSHKLMVGMSYISDKELFKSCVEYWWWLGDLMLRSPASNVKKNLMTKLAPVLSDVRYVLIRRMAKPEEVVIVEDDNELRREHMQDVEELQLYQLMRESLVFLTNLDSRDTRGIMVKLMEKLLDRSEWSWHNCNTLAWAVGAISMALPVEDEEELFVTIVKGLLLLCKEMVGKENRAVVASAIIFVVGQYPRFLRSHLPFLYTVSRKIFEFMREPFPGVQDMAIDTLLKLTKQLAPCYVDRRTEPTFANVMAAQWPTIIELLNQPQVQSSFAAVGYIIEAELADSQAQLLYAFLNELNLRFKALTSTATTPGSNFCSNAMSMTELLHYMRIYSSVADSCGDAFIHQMNLIIYDLYGFYRLFSAAQKTTIAEGGVTALSRQETKYLRLLKREVLRIFERFVEHTGHLDFVATNCLPDLLGVVLEDYRDSIPEAKEAGALALVAACVRSLGDRLSCECEPILDHTFNTTVAMISDSMESYPEFRVNLFKLLDAFNKHCFTAFVMYASVHEDVLGGMLWAIKHTDYPTMSTGLELLNHFLANVQTSNFAEPFFMAYLQRILVEVLVAAMDSLHAAGFSLHCSILMKVFAVSASLPFDTPVVGAEAVLSFLRENLRAIPTLTEASIDAFVKECYQCTRDEARFRTMFADFLVEVKVWGAEQENKMQEEDERRLREETIPGFSSLFSDPPPNAFHQSHMSHNSVDFGNMSLL